MKKLVALLLAVLMVLSMAACSKKEEGASASVTLDEKFVGTWVGFLGEAYDVELLPEQVANYVLNVQADGTVTLTTEVSEFKMSGVAEGDTLTITESNLDITNEAILADGVLYVENLLDMNTNIFFAKDGEIPEGTFLTDPEEDLEEDDGSELLGVWGSYQVLNAIDEDVSDEIPADAMVLTFLDEDTVDVMIGEDLYPGESYEYYDGFGWLADIELDISFEITEDGEMKVDYYDAEENGYYFTCAKVEL
ncbi:MAG: hypothetical protein IKW04_01520 [Clostridia bacterium]|nr:hypothetical protein [Clostridia bacterium]